MDRLQMIAKFINPFLINLNEFLSTKIFWAWKSPKLSIKSQRIEKKEKKSEYRFSDHTQFKVHLQLLA